MATPVSSGLWLALGAMLIAACAGTLSWAAKRQGEYESLVLSRFREAAGAELVAPGPRKRNALQGWIDDELRRAGLEMTPRITAVLAGGVPFVLIVAAAVAGFSGALVTIVAGVLLGLSLLSYRVEKRRTALLDALPRTVEQVSRAVATGSSLQQGFLVATEEAAGPMRELLERVVRQTRVGVPLEDSLDQAAAIWSIRELEMLAFTVRVSQRYGGSVRSALARIVAAVRQREKASRELRALTAETRLSAWILGCLPLGIGSYVAIVNPDYVGHMVEDPTGRFILYFALGLQALGAGVIWRMVRSV